MLASMGLVTPDQLSEAASLAGERDISLTEALVVSRACTEVDLQKGRALQMGLEFLDELDPDEIDPSIVAPFTATYAKQNLMLPLKVGEKRVRVCVADPLNVGALDDLQLVFSGTQWICV